MKLAKQTVSPRRIHLRHPMQIHLRRRSLAIMLAVVSAAAGAVFPVGAQQGGSPSCRISGRVTSSAAALPGVSIVALSGDVVAAATSTEIDGTYQLAIAPGAYRLKAELTGFKSAEQSVTFGGEPCVQSVNLSSPSRHARHVPRPPPRRPAVAHASRP